MKSSTSTKLNSFPASIFEKVARDLQQKKINKKKIIFSVQQTFDSLPEDLKIFTIIFSKSHISLSCSITDLDVESILAAHWVKTNI